MRRFFADWQLFIAQAPVGTNSLFARCPVNHRGSHGLPRRYSRRTAASGICRALLFARRKSLPGQGYARAADSLAALLVPLAQIIEAGRKLHRTGTHPSLEAMRKEIPAGVLEMLAVLGLRPDKVPSTFVLSCDRLRTAPFRALSPTGLFTAMATLASEPDRQR